MVRTLLSFGIYAAVALTVAAPLCAASKPPSSAQIRRAQKHVERAGKHFDNKRWTDAIVEYQLALALAPEAPLLIWNIARSYEELGDGDRAIRYFERFLSMKITPAYREAAQVKLRALRYVPEPTAEPVAPAEPEPVVSEVPDPAQQPDPVVVLAGYAGRDRRALVAGWSLFGTGLAVAGAGAALMAVGQGRYSTVLDSSAVDGVHPATQIDAQAAQEDGDTLTISGIVALSLGGAAVITGLVLVLTAPDEPPPMTPTVSVGDHDLTFGVWGSF